MDISSLELDNRCSWIFYIEYREFRYWPDQAYGETVGETMGFFTTAEKAVEWVENNAAQSHSADIPCEFWIITEPVDAPTDVKPSMALIGSYDSNGVLIHNFVTEESGPGDPMTNYPTGNNEPDNGESNFDNLSPSEQAAIEEKYGPIGTITYRWFDAEGEEHITREKPNHLTWSD